MMDLPTTDQPTTDQPTMALTVKMCLAATMGHPAPATTAPPAALLATTIAPLTMRATTAACPHAPHLAYAPHRQVAHRHPWAGWRGVRMKSWRIKHLPKVVMYTKGAGSSLESFSLKTSINPSPLRGTTLGILITFGRQRITRALVSGQFIHGSKTVISGAMALILNGRGSICNSSPTRRTMRSRPLMSSPWMKSSRFCNWTRTLQCG